MIYNAVEALVGYALEKGLIGKPDVIYTRNRLLDVLREDGFEKAEPLKDVRLCDILKILTDHAVEKGLCADSAESRDIFDTRLTDCLTMRPSEIGRRFKDDYAVSPERATGNFYKYCGDINYIRRDRIEKDRKWKTDSEYGVIDITINLSKPEKDPRDIALAGRSASNAYPLCQLCKENVGYAGRIGHPARANLRVVPIGLCGEEWFFQYSPYVYYNEHCIVFNGNHVPMKISEKTFLRLLEFVRLFPHYFLGSNADLPIVGGSILSHDHFQGGRYDFAMERAGIEYGFKIKGFEDVECGIVKWPLSVIRIRGRDSVKLASLASRILSKWREYTDESSFIFAKTDGTSHNTVTPIARRRGGDYELDLCLRNNITTKEHPLGQYHPHAEYHHIKKENIGLIEVMGLAVLPSRLQKELELLERYISAGKDIRSEESIAKHADWASGFAKELYGKPDAVIKERLESEVGKVFIHVLENAGVFFGNKDGFLRFIKTI